jgi:superfamily II DNA/RNA helicase
MQSKMNSGKALTYLLPIVQCLASSINDGRCPSPGGGTGVAGADHKSGGTWCILLCPTREPVTQMHLLLTDCADLCSPG